ncbi:hypothetical protein EVAR_7182_1 [Eumeta japonica]|uniref:Uncharacterized protein n=1 Tax=Eumeta variegata TaxID=151549 RepID=A0A4C1U6H8_EUMVA|nr:hypothetical protein EVAR_7182_1 [Eumeta japonica]
MYVVSAISLLRLRIFRDAYVLCPRMDMYPNLQPRYADAHAQWRLCSTGRHPLNSSGKLSSPSQTPTQSSPAAGPTMGPASSDTPLSDSSAALHATCRSHFA